MRDKWNEDEGDKLSRNPSDDVQYSDKVNEKEATKKTMKWTTKEAGKGTVPV